MPRVARLLSLLIAILALSAAAPVSADPLRFPLDDYPIDDACGAWGWLNPNFLRCGLPGKHVADDACVPFGTTVYAVLDGRIMLAEEIGDCTTNWGWLTVAEHTRDDGTTFCAVYGHCQPLSGIGAGSYVTRGEPIARVNWPCGRHHIHFGIAIGAWGASLGGYPDWLLGYLPAEATCAAYPVPFPGRYVDPVAFVLESMPVAPRHWGDLKRRAE